jgi:hypothetical protein
VDNQDGGPNKDRSQDKVQPLFLLDGAVQAQFVQIHLNTPFFGYKMDAGIIVFNYKGKF